MDSDDKQAKTQIVLNKKKASAKECKKLNASLQSNCFSSWENTKYVPVIIESFLQNSLRTRTALYFLTLFDFGSLSSSKNYITVYKASSTASAVILPPASANIPRQSAVLSTNSLLFYESYFRT